jgi:hypothetical protein
VLLCVDIFSQAVMLNSLAASAMTAARKKPGDQESVEGIHTPFPFIMTGCSGDFVAGLEQTASGR